MVCTAGCIASHTCGRTPSTPVEMESPAPYVIMNLGGLITVGNESAPCCYPHDAVIKSMQYGTSNGNGCVVEVLDAQGGTFATIADELNKCLPDAAQDYKMTLEWGWVGRTCDGPASPVRSKKVTFIPRHLQVDFTEGKVKFQITGVDLMEVSFEARCDKNKGDDDQKVPLKEAIRNMFQDCDPKIEVDFLRKTANGGTEEWGFRNRDGGFNGPIQTWNPNNMDKMQAAREWMRPFCTENDKGIEPAWDCVSGRLIFWEDNSPECDDNLGCEQAIASYIVNGGNCSPVISFTPQIKWDFVAVGSSGGDTSGGADGATEVKEGRPKCEMQQNKRGVGTLTNIPMTNFGLNQHGPKEVIKQQKENQVRHESANRTYFPISAELRIQGDPRYVSPIFLRGATLAIAVVNPFHLRGGSNGCGDWIASPGCNPILSNTAWRIEGVDHYIKEGSYTTTFNLKLDTPGSNINPGLPTGGSDGWKPKGAC